LQKLVKSMTMALPSALKDAHDIAFARYVIIVNINY
jgi:hypothetical protein